MVAKLIAKAGRTVYRYRINHPLSQSYINTTWEGSVHCMDMLYVFGSHFYQGSDITLTDDDEVDMTVNVIKYWSNFAKSGNPNFASEESVEEELTMEEKRSLWPQFTVEEPAFKDLSLSMRNGNALKAKECTLWNDLIPRMNTLIDELKRCQREQHWSRSSCSADGTSCEGTAIGGDTKGNQSP